MNGGQQPVDLGWRTLGELVLTAFIAVEGWLLRKVWNSKLDREEALRMFEEWTRRDEELDRRQFQAIRDEIVGMRSEARGCFKDVGDRIDGIYQLLAKPRGH